MSKRFICISVLASLLTTAAFASSKKKPAAEPPDAGESADIGSEKSHFEAFLRDRLGKVQESHKRRMAFFEKEKSDWETFWTKIRDERKKFMIRVTQQTMDLTESLSSLDPKDRPATSSNFERLQSDLIKSFDQKQKQRMQDFFADHDARWKDFASGQDKERADFMADAAQGWHPNKNPNKPMAKAAAPADDSTAPDAQDAQDETPPPPKKKAKKAASSDSASGDSNDVWH